MRRTSSQLLHDYKPTATKPPKKSKALQWFAVGLGIPLLGVALLSTLDSPKEEAVVPDQAPGMAALPGEPFPTDEIVVSDVPLVYAPEPEYEAEKGVIEVVDLEEETKESAPPPAAE